MATRCLILVSCVVLGAVQAQKYKIAYPDMIFFNNDDGERYPVRPFDNSDLVSRRGNVASLSTTPSTQAPPNDSYGMNLLAGDNVVGTNILSKIPQSNYENAQTPQSLNFMNPFAQIALNPLRDNFENPPPFVPNNFGSIPGIPIPPNIFPNGFPPSNFGIPFFPNNNNPLPQNIDTRPLNNNVASNPYPQDSATSANIRPQNSAFSSNTYPQNNNINSNSRPQNSNSGSNAYPPNSNPATNIRPQSNNFGDTAYSQNSNTASNIRPQNNDFGSNIYSQNINSNNNIRPQNSNSGSTAFSQVGNIGNNVYSPNNNAINKPSRFNPENDVFQSNSNFGNNQNNIRPTQRATTNREVFYRPTTERYDTNVAVSSVGWSANASKPIDAAALSISDFGIYLMKISQERRGNVVLSPFSIANLLALLQQGSLGATQQQISNALQLSPKQSAEGFKRILRTIQKSRSHNILNVANGVFMGSVFNPNPAYIRTASEDFGSEVSSLMFDKPTAVQKINKWVSKKTNNKIENLIPPNVVDAETQLVLVNAVYFKGLWAVKFRPELTVQKEFYLGNGRPKTASFMRMHRLLKTDIDREIASEVLVLPFEEEQYSLVIILPSETTSVANALSALTKEKLLSYQNLTPKEVSVEIPKFNAKTETDLFQVFQRMGIIDMFGPRSDLSGIGHYNNYPPRVNSAIHSAMLSIDEQGGVAAGATSFVAIALSNDEPIVTFIVNRPFLAVLWDNENSTPLFMAKIEDPVS